MARRHDFRRFYDIRVGLAAVCCAALITSPAVAQVSWKRVGTVSTLTSGQLCRTDGTLLICDSTTPTISSGDVGIGTTTPLSALSVNGGAAIGSYAGLNAAPSNGLIISGSLGIGTSSPNASAALDLGNTTSSIIVPKGATEPASAVAGMMRFNTATATFEGYDGSTWYDFGGSAGTFGAGTVTAPGWAVTSDTASGLFQATTGTLSIAAGGTEAARFLQGSGTVVNYPTFTGASTGNGVTIASAGSDTNINLNLSPKGTGNTIISSGNVGIGITRPSGLLNLSSNTAGNGLTVDNYGSGPLPEISFRGAEGTAASPTAVNSGDTIGAVLARGYGATGFASASRASINFGATQNWSDANQGTYIVFKTTPNSTTTTAEVMRIDQSGYVGIGTTTPQSKLDVSGGAAIGTSYAGVTAAPTNGAIIQGNVGIGTTAPASGVKADIAGLVKVAGTGSEPCTAAQVGAMRYNPTGNYFELCSYP